MKKTNSETQNNICNNKPITLDEINSRTFKQKDYPIIQPIVIHAAKGRYTHFDEVGTDSGKIPWASLSDRDMIIEEHKLYEVSFDKIPQDMLPFKTDKGVYLGGVDWTDQETIKLMFFIAPKGMTIQPSDNIHIVFGHPLDLKFGIFRLEFLISRDYFAASLEQGINFLDIIKRIEPCKDRLSIKEEIDLLGNMCTLEESKGSLPVWSEEESLTDDMFLIENFVFCRNISKYAYRANFEKLDFFLTYDVKDLAIALRNGSNALRDFLINAQTVKVSDEFDKVFSLYCPENMKSARNFVSNYINYTKNYHSQKDVDCGLKELYKGVDTPVSSVAKVTSDKIKTIISRMTTNSTKAFLDKYSQFETRFYKETANPSLYLDMPEIAQRLEPSQFSAMEREEYNTDSELIFEGIRFYSWRPDIDFLALLDLLSEMSRQFSDDDFKSLYSRFNPVVLTERLASYMKNGFAFHDGDVKSKPMFDKKGVEIIETLSPEERLLKAIFGDYKPQPSKSYLTFFLPFYTIMREQIAAVSCFPAFYELLSRLTTCVERNELEHLRYEIEDLMHYLSSKESSTQLFYDQLVKYNKAILTQKSSNSIPCLVPSSHEEYLHRITSQTKAQLNEQEIIVAETREKEREQLLRDLSHDIKNIIVGIKGPIERVASSSSDDPCFDATCALNGANMISRIVWCINNSYKSTPNDFIEDIYDPSKDALSLEDIVIFSLRNAVANMFDKDYHCQFAENYFLENYSEAYNAWKSTDNAGLISFVNTYMANCKFEMPQKLKKILIGNSHGSATKLMIIVNELFINAMKAVSFITNKEQRNIDILIDFDKDSMLTISTQNNFKGVGPGAGRGRIIIENFIKSFGGSMDYSDKNRIFRVLLTIPFRLE